MKQSNRRKTIAVSFCVLLTLTLSFIFVSFVIPVIAATPVTIEQNGSRIIVKDAGDSATYEWQIANTVDGEFKEIDGQVGRFYDITFLDKGSYIRAVVNGVATDPVGPIGTVIVMDIGKGAISLGTSYSGKDSDGNTVSGTHTSSNIYVVTHKQNDVKTTNNIVFKGTHVNNPFNVTLDNVNMGATPTNHNQDPGVSGVSTPGSGQISIPATQSEIKKVTIVLKGENQVRNITYYNAGDVSNPQTVSSSLKFIGMPVSVERTEILSCRICTLQAVKYRL